MAERKTTFRPGQFAPVSGIYFAIHADAHRAPHEVMVIRGEELPTCRTCKSNVVFEVLEVVPHVRHDMDFAGLAHTVI